MRAPFLRILPFFLLAVLIAGVMAWLFSLKGHLWVFVIEERRYWLAGVAASPVLARGLFMLGYALYVLAGIPASLFLTMLGGFLFGFAEAVLMACCAATLGAVGLIAIIRRYFRPWAQKRLGTRYEKMAQGFRRDDVFYLLFMRLMPVFPFWVVNLVVAVMDMPLRRFAPVSFFGMMPAAMAAALVGTGLDQALEGPATQLAACRSLNGSDCAAFLTMPDLLQPDFVLAASLMGLFALLPPLWRRFRSDQK
jgi:uncharacterized membrane protein YdjX (TVP38/TMEM64 family)